VAGIQNFRRLGIHVHTNTTLCAPNLDHASEVVRFVARELGLQTLSMNMVIRTGMAESGAAVGVTYAQVADRLPALLATAAEEHVRLVWYSPMPYCLFNPVLHDLGGKACACVDGILSIDPSGQVLPCSSFGAGIGSLLARPFEEIYNSEAARYWREKRFTPPACSTCPDVDVCGGACPLYWDAAGGFTELPQPGADDARSRVLWEQGRAAGRSFGVVAPGSEEGTWAR
jgi:radical SAM protein with 4Fe4S-binding SPASM domain